VAEVEREWRLIRKELDAVMTFRDQMRVSRTSSRKSRESSRTTIGRPFSSRHRMDCAQNAQRCRRQYGCSADSRHDHGVFSILSPGKHIPAHRGAWNGILRFHLGLMVPEPRERVRIRIGNDFIPGARARR